MNRVSISTLTYFSNKDFFAHQITATKKPPLWKVVLFIFIDVSFIDYKWKRSSESLVANPFLFNNTVDTWRDKLLSSQCKDIVIVKPLRDFIV